MKKCNKCEETKQINQFYKNKHRNDGYSDWCITCEKERHKKYHIANKEKRNTKNKLWRTNNKEKEALRKLSWKRKNPEKRHIVDVRHNTKRKRNFGYVKINKKEYGTVGHHIDKNLVVYIPENLHKSIVHKQTDKISMKEINIMSIQTCYI